MSKNSDKWDLQLVWGVVLIIILLAIGATAVVGLIKLGVWIWS